MTWWDPPAVAFDAPRLDRLRRIGLACCILVVLAFGVATEMRGAFLEHRHTDAGVFFRAGWAAASGESLYGVADENGWHYHYPPLLAILLMPFADPPAGAAPPPYALPYPVSLALWYAINVALALAACHLLATALEGRSAAAGFRPAGRFGPRWWALRLWPLFFLIAPIGETVARGQSSIIVMFAVSAAAAALLRGRDAGAGAWLGLAAAIKLFPGLVALELLRRRSARGLLGLALALLLGFAVVPLLALGPERTYAAYDEFLTQRALAWLEGELSPAVDKELLDPGQLDLLSLETIQFKAAHPDPASRPASIPPLYGWLHWAAGFALLGATLVAARPNRASDAGVPDPSAAAEQPLLALGALAIVAALMLPGAQTHYLAVALPVAAGLLWRSWRRRSELRFFSPVHWPLPLYMAVTLVGELPGVRRAIDIAPEGWAALGLWAAALWALRSDRRAPSSDRSSEGFR